MSFRHGNGNDSAAAADGDDGDDVLQTVIKQIQLAAAAAKTASAAATTATAPATASLFPQFRQMWMECVAFAFHDAKGNHHHYQQQQPQQHQPGQPPPLSSLDLAVVAGSRSPSLSFAFGAGYQAALRALLEPHGRWRRGELYSMCVTEGGSGHPRRMRTTVRTSSAFPSSSSSSSSSSALSSPVQTIVNGVKSFITLGSEATILCVACLDVDDHNAATTSTAAAAAAASTALPRIRLVLVPTTTPPQPHSGAGGGGSGLQFTAIPMSMLSDLPHASCTFSEVRCGDPTLAVLPGDGYTQYVKRFRTLEDLHVNAAFFGYLLQLAVCFAWPAEVVCQVLAVIAALRNVNDLHATATATTQTTKPMSHPSPAVNLAVAGVLSQAQQLLQRLDNADDDLWQRVKMSDRSSSSGSGGEDITLGWQRDKKIFAIAGRARAARTATALKQLGLPPPQQQQQQRKDRRKPEQQQQPLQSTL
jgi:acyl-CoA dehydrogenase